MNVVDKNLKINVKIIKEGITFVAYSPGLKISGYGVSIEAAKESFKVVLSTTINYMIKNDSFNWIT
jgi:hypothetical protein